MNLNRRQDIPNDLPVVSFDVRVLPFNFLKLSFCWRLRLIGDGIVLVLASLYVVAYKNESRFGGSYPIVTCSKTNSVH